MLHSRYALKKAALKLNELERNDINVKDGSSGFRTNKVFKAAINYTVHQNHLMGSLLLLIPFAKPIVRIAQGIIFHNQRKQYLRGIFS